MYVKFAGAQTSSARVVWKLGEGVPVQVSSSPHDHASKLRATRGLLATDHVILNHGQVTWTTPDLAPPLLTTTPTGGRFSSTDLTCINCPTRWVFSGTGLELLTRQATIRYLYHSATAVKMVPQGSKSPSAGLLVTDFVILNHGQVMMITLELARPSLNFHTTPTGGRLSLDIFNVHQLLCTVVQGLYRALPSSQDHYLALKARRHWVITAPQRDHNLCLEEEFPGKKSFRDQPLYPASSLARPFDCIQRERPDIVELKTSVVDTTRKGEYSFQ
ncbi:uncharacterized protein TNCV_3269241 [Trichonephila clavipes]|nr:uncharacterized protein TNCV_3269241 [Trichonephila clavipes]